MKVSILEWNSSSTVSTFLKLHYCYYYFICITMYNKYMTVQYTINVYAEVTIHKIKNTFQVHTFLGYRVQRQSSLLNECAHFISFNTYILFCFILNIVIRLDEKAVMIGRVWLLLQSHKYSLEISIK